jgi:drug/metabolite transporter (DMT)-like permease
MHIVNFLTVRRQPKKGKAVHAPVPQRECISRSTSRGFVCLTIAVVLWASVFSAIRTGLMSFSPGTLALFRFCVASLVILVWSRVTPFRSPSLREVPRLSLLGFLGVTAFSVLLGYGERTVLAGAAGLLVNTSPLWTTCFAVTFLKEPPAKVTLLGSLMGVVGVILIVLGRGPAISATAGAVYILMAALCQAAFWTLQKTLLKSYRPVECTAYAIWFGTLFLGIFSAQLLQEIQHATLASIWSAVYIGIFPGAVPYVAWGYVMARMPASKSVVFLYVVPFFSLLVAWRWLGEVPAPLAIAGGAFVIGGAVIANSKWTRLRRAKRDEVLVAAHATSEKCKTVVVNYCE